MGVVARSFVEQTWTWEAHFLRLEAEMFDAFDGSDCSMTVPTPPSDSSITAMENSNHKHNPILSKVPRT